jgi:hypothetical protein
MLGKQSGQMSFGDMEAMGRRPDGHFLRKSHSQIDWRPFETVLEPLYHPKSLSVNNANFSPADYGCCQMLQGDIGPVYPRSPMIWIASLPS